MRNGAEMIRYPSFIIPHSSFIVFSLLLASCASSAASPSPLPTFTPRALPSPSSTVEGAPFIPTLTPAPLGQLPGTVANYHFDVTLDYLGHRAQVIESITVINPGPDNWTEIVLQLPTALRSNTFLLTGITLSEDAAATNAAYQLAGGLLRVPLPAGLGANAAAIVTVNYGLAAPRIALDTRPPDGNVGYSDGLIQFIHWYPILVPYQTGKGWATSGPDSLTPLPADPIFTETANYDLTVATAKDVSVISGGPTASTPGRWTFTLKNARTIAFAASDRYQSLAQTEGGVTITSYFLPEHAEAGLAALTAASQSLLLFSDLFGAYPYQTLVIGENGYYGSAAGGGAVFQAGRGYADYVGNPDSLLIALAPQTISRLWWGQVVSGDSYTQPWLNEALPMYAELLFYQAFYPDLESWYWEARINYWQPAGKLDRPAGAFADSDDYSRNLLRRGAQFMRDVRAQVGDDAFFAFLQDYYRSGAYRAVTADDFFNALRRHSPADLDPLLLQYFTQQIMPTPAPTVTPIGPPAPTPMIHVVRSGETLTTIAQKYGVTVEAIVKANGLSNADAIYVGQQLVIPAGGR